jgi:acetyl-CoA carboxylase biotin carboxylase subunit
VVGALLRQRIAEAAAAVARSVNYTNAGTIEFLVDEDGSFYFLEMNTRLQVEHPVTEMVTSVDLVQWQIRIAHGWEIDIDPRLALTPRGHAIECRIYAEDPDEGFMPFPGLVRAIRPAAGPGIRDDGGVSAGYRVPVYYDSMIAKLVAWAGSRDETIARMARALDEYEVVGIRTTIPFFQWLMRQPEYRAGQYDTTYLDRLLVSRRGETFSVLSDRDQDVVTMAAALDAFMRSSAAGAVRPSAATRSLWQEMARREALRE